MYLYKQTKSKLTLNQFKHRKIYIKKAFSSNIFD